jgi:hypothetical protein
MVSTPSTSGNGPIPLSTSTTAPFTQSAMSHPFSYGIPRFDINSFLTYSTLQTMGLEEGSSNSPKQVSTGGTYFSFNVNPYGGDHIPPPSPSLDCDFQSPIMPNTNYRLFGGDILGTSSYTTLVGSMSFSLFGVFGNNVFSSTALSAGGNSIFGQQNLVQGTIHSQGTTTRVFSTQGLWNPWKGSVPLKGMLVGGNPFHTQWNPRQGFVPMLVRSNGGIPFQGP